MELKGTKPTIISAFYKSRATPKAKFNRQEAQVWTRGWAQEGHVCVLPRAALQWDSRTSVAAQGTRTRDEAATTGGKLNLNFQLSFMSMRRGVWGKGSGEADLIRLT